METPAVTTPSVQNAKTMQTTSAQPAQKDVVSEANSFQNTLKDLETTNNKVQETSDLKTDVSTANKNETVQIAPKEVKDNGAEKSIQNPVQNINDIQKIASQMQEKQANKVMPDAQNEDLKAFNFAEKQADKGVVNTQNEEIKAFNFAEKQADKGLADAQNETLKAFNFAEKQANKGMLDTKNEEPKVFNPAEKQANKGIVDINNLALTPDEILKNNPKTPETYQEDEIADKNALIAGVVINQIKDSKVEFDKLSDLNSKIMAINSVTAKSTTAAKAPLGSIKVSAEDASFFAKMVENANNNIQTNVSLNVTNNQVNMTDAKAQNIQSSAAVSQALIEKLQESMKTNKAFRVDFDKDVAVIMRVDSNGMLSANFIPGSSAVEQALRNNLAELRQALDNKGIEYNELSYTSRQQKQKQQRNQKGGKDE